MRPLCGLLPVAGWHAHDAAGRRIRKLLGTNPAAPTLALDYYHNTGGQIIEAHKDGVDDHPLEQYVWSPRYVHAPILRWRDGNTDGDLEDEGDSTLYYCNDANFNVTALVDGTSGSETFGQVVERYLYDPYGKVTFLKADWSLQDGDEQHPAGTISACANELLFTGHRLDPESGLYITLHRHYHPTLGRWMQRDPKGYIDGLSLYAYLKSAPENATDPEGTQVFIVTFEVMFDLDPIVPRSLVPRPIAEGVKPAVEQGFKTAGETFKSAGETFKSAGETVKSAGETIKSAGETIKSAGETVKSAAKEAVKSGKGAAESGKNSGEGPAPPGPGSQPKPNPEGLRPPCFVAGTLVSTPKGLVPIEQITAGDTVFAYDFEKERVVEETVLKALRGRAKQLVDVKFCGETISATRLHFFWIEHAKRWVPAIALCKGDEVRLSSGEIVQIEGITLYEHSRATYNLEVERLHNYFVGVNSVLVHNGLITEVYSGPGRPPIPGRPNSIYEKFGPQGDVTSRYFLDENGFTFSRQDFAHEHGGMQEHEHLRDFDAQGRPITKENVRPLPQGYDNTPTSSPGCK